MFKCKTFGLFFLFLLFGTYCQAIEGSATSQSSIEGIVSSKSRFEILVPGITGGRGVIKDFEGTASYNPNDITQTEYYVKLNLQTAEAGVKGPFMKSEMFLDASNYPYASFTATHNIATGDYTMDMHGNLTMKGVTHPAVFHVVIDPSSNADEVRHTSTAELDRRDWGIDTLSSVISNTVKITLHGVITRKS